MSESIVKPLEWRNTNGREWAGDPPLRYTVYALPWGFVTNRGECGIPFGDDVHQSMEAAKKAARDDLESLVASILSIDPASIQSLKDEIAAKDERIARLEEALERIGLMHDGNPPLPLADIPEIDYARRTISNIHREAREALRDTEETDATSDRLSAVEEMMGRSGGRS